MDDNGGWLDVESNPPFQGRFEVRVAGDPPRVSRRARVTLIWGDWSEDWMRVWSDIDPDLTGNITHWRPIPEPDEPEAR